MSVHPVNLQRDSPNRSLVIQWSDGQEQQIPFRTLRDRCPCAACRTPQDQPEPDTGGLKILSPAETMPLEIVAMRPVGNYAYNIEFSDQHNTGIFTFDLLRSLTEQDLL